MAAGGICSVLLPKLVFPPTMEPMRNYFPFLLLSLVLWGCTATAEPRTATAPPDRAESAAQTATLPPAAPSATATVVTPPATATVPLAAPAITVTPRGRMEATDPAAVEVGAGQLQLIEFFAFW